MSGTLPIEAQNMGEGVKMASPNTLRKKFAEYKQIRDTVGAQNPDTISQKRSDYTRLLYNNLLQHWRALDDLDKSENFKVELKKTESYQAYKHFVDEINALRMKQTQISDEEHAEHMATYQRALRDLESLKALSQAGLDAVYNKHIKHSAGPAVTIAHVFDICDTMIVTFAIVNANRAFLPTDIAATLLADSLNILFAPFLSPKERKSLTDALDLRQILNWPAKLINTFLMLNFIPLLPGYSNQIQFNNAKFSAEIEFLSKVRKHKDPNIRYKMSLQGVMCKNTQDDPAKWKKASDDTQRDYLEILSKHMAKKGLSVDMPTYSSEVTGDVPSYSANTSPTGPLASPSEGDPPVLAEPQDFLAQRAAPAGAQVESEETSIEEIRGDGPSISGQVLRPFQRGSLNRDLSQHPVDRALP